MFQKHARYFVHYSNKGICLSLCAVLGIGPRIENS
jgi:hypothetical protein